MLSPSLTLEVLLFSLINFIPYVILSVFTFYKQLRFSKPVTYLVCAFLLIVQFVTRYWSAMHNVALRVDMSILRLVVFLFCYILLFEVHWGKVIFLELIFANIGNFIIIAAVCLERNIFPNIDHHLYCWHASVAMLILHMFITLPYTFTLKKYFKPIVSVNMFAVRWRYYWLVPGVFYFIWQYQVNGGPTKGVEIISHPYNIIFLFIINLGSYLIYQLTIQLDGQLVQNYALEKEKRFHDLETLELKLLEERIMDARRAKHDLRHHMIIIEDCLNEGDYDRLRAYVTQFSNTLPDNDSLQFCKNRVINTLLLYYGRQAKSHNIDFQVDLSIENDVKLPDSDIAVILSNLLENALFACKNAALTSKKIIIHGKSTKDALFFTIDNTFDNEIVKNEKGQFLTTKKTGSGIGIESVKHLVARYNGTFTTEQKDNIFYVSFMLNL